MTPIEFSVDGKSGDYVRATLAPANRSEEAHFGILDGVIIAFFVVCVSSLVYLLVG